MIFCFDLDGTLLNSNGVIPDDTMDLLRQIRINNNIYIVSGRHFSESKCFYEKLNLSKDDYLICSDGLYIYDVSGSCIYKFQSLCIEDLNYLKTNFATYDFFVVTNKDNFYNSKSKLNSIINRLRGHKTIDTLIESYGTGIVIEKIVFDNLNCKEIDIINNYGLKTVKYRDNRVEVYHMDVSKYNAIQYLLNLSNKKNDQIIYFGDEMNEYECFKNFPKTVSFANANPIIKEMASVVTSSNDTGVHDYLKEYIEKQR